MPNNITRSRERIKRTGEVFTPTILVSEILDKLPQRDPEIFKDSHNAFCDPACGNGQFIMGVLNKKVEAYNDTEYIQEDYKTLALKETYGVDFMASNIADLIARIVFWKTWDGEQIFDEQGQPKRGLVIKQKTDNYCELDNALWLKAYVEGGNTYKRKYQYNNHNVFVRNVKKSSKNKSTKWWMMEYCIPAAQNKVYSRGKFCQNFLVADSLRYDFEFDEYAPVLETKEEEYIRLAAKMVERNGKVDRSGIKW